MQRVSRDLGTLLAQGVEPELKRVGVKGTPIRQEGVQPVAGHASLPARPDAHRRSIAVQPAAELTQRIGGQPTTLLNDSRSPVILHATHPDMRYQPADVRSRLRSEHPPDR